MPGHTIPFPSITNEIYRMAKASFDRDNFFILVGEQLSVLLEDIEFAGLPTTELLPKDGGAILPLVSFFQYIEELTDTQVADAIRSRVEWKFALHLRAIAAEFHRDELCEFRQYVISNSECQEVFQKLIQKLLMLKPQMGNKPENVEVLSMVSTICFMNRLSLVEEAMCQTLECLAGRFPEWLRRVALAHWYVRYTRKSPGPSQASLQRQLGLSIADIGADIQYLLAEAAQSDSPEIKELQEIAALNHIWKKQFEIPIQTSSHKPAEFSEKECAACVVRTDEKDSEATNISMFKNLT
jgi:transposase